MRAVLRSGAIALFASVFLLAQAGNGLGYSYFNPLPRGPVLLKRPSLGVRVQRSTGDDAISVQLFLDGLPVPTTVGDDGWYGYQPMQPLASGRHQVSAVISSAGYQEFRTSSDFVVSSTALDTLPTPEPEAQVAQSMINRLRQQLGLPTLVYDQTLGAAALYHARYDITHPDGPDAHGERPGAAGFTGEDALARSQAFGYAGVGTDEVIDFKLRAEENVADWLSTLYHRLPLVSPASRSVGYGMALGRGGESVGVAVMGTKPPGAPLVTVYPANGQTNVPTAWAGREHPDPLRLYPGAAGPLGYTITASFAPAPHSLTLTGYSLRTASGSPVAVYDFSPANDDQLQDTVALIPKAPLLPGTTYQVELRGTTDQGGGLRPYQRNWSFTTAREPWVTVSGKRFYYNAGNELSRVELTGSGFVPGMQVFLQGLKAPGVVVDSDTKLRFNVPPGFTGGLADLSVTTPGGQEETWPSFFDGSEGFANQGSPVSLRPLVGGPGVVASALRLADGATLLPAKLVEALGYRVSYDGRTGRLLATAETHEVTALPGRALALVDGSPLVMGATAREQHGLLYVPSSLVQAGADAVNLPLAINVGGDGDVTVTLAGFTDVLGHWAQGGITRLAGAQVVSGYGDRTFRPEAVLTRGAYLKMVVAVAGIAPVAQSIPWISDTKDHWLQTQGFLAAGVGAGILTRNDAPDGQFRPDAPIDRQTMAVWAVRALGLEGAAAGMLDSRTQVNIKFLDGGSVSESAAPYVVLAAQQGLITGYAEGARYVYKPQGGATRAEAVTVVDRLRSKLGR